MANSCLEAPGGGEIRHYIDTDVFVNYFALKESKSKKIKSKRYLTDVEEGKFQGLVTDFVIIETLGALMRAICRTEERALVLQEIADIENSVEEFVEDLGVEVHSADALSSPPNKPTDVFGESRKTIKSVTPVEFNRDWKHFGGADALHLVFARRIGADRIATFDNGFRSATSIVAPFLLQEEY